MKNLMKYKGYIGSVEFSEADKTFFGKVQGIRALISYEGTTGDTLLSDFHDAIDDYLSLCKNTNKEPEKTYKGSFNIRIPPELHKKAFIYATEHQMTLNNFVEKAIERTLITAK